MGGRPERTTYQLTAAGEEEFRTLLREEWWNLRPITDPLMAALSFLSCLPRAEAIAALEQRIVQIRGLARGHQFAIDAIDGTDAPMHVREMMWLLTARVTAEIGWAGALIGRLRAGEYITGDEPAWKPAAMKSKAARAPRQRAPARRARSSRRSRG